ncbi:MAG: hypothetical protein IIB33_06655 [Chloroflexi bacterium]|nr:hypothetical protein [Chloroflexota bacterium]
MSQSQKEKIRETILASNDLPKQSVECPEWGQTLHVRTLTGSERDDFENTVQSASKGKGGIDLRGLKIKLVLLTLCDEDGELLFDATDALVLNSKSSKVIDRIFQVSQQLNGLTAEDVDEMVKNSDGDQTAASGSA